MLSMPIFFIAKSVLKDSRRLGIIVWLHVFNDGVRQRFLGHIAIVRWIIQLIVAVGVTGILLEYFWFVISSPLLGEVVLLQVLWRHVQLVIAELLAVEKHLVADTRLILNTALDLATSHLHMLLARSFFTIVQVVGPGVAGDALDASVVESRQKFDLGFLRRGLVVVRGYLLGREMDARARDHRLFDRLDLSGSLLLQLDQSQSLPEILAFSDKAIDVILYSAALCLLHGERLFLDLPALQLAGRRFFVPLLHRGELALTLIDDIL